MNANLNGGAYLGLRNDIYSIKYSASPLLLKSERKINHFGFSAGIFTGIGNTLVSSTSTNNLASYDYEGIVWSKGLAGIFAINNFTVGISIGIDYLMDKNRSIWIYQNQPWAGLAFGLNLN